MYCRRSRIAICCAALPILAAAAIIVQQVQSGNYIPRAARNSRVVNLTESTTNVTTSEPFWGSDPRGKGGLDIAWGPTIPRAQWIKRGEISAAVTFRVPKGFYAYPIVKDTYERHTYRWRQVDSGGKTLIRNPDGSAREYMASVDRYRGSTIDWAGPFSRNAPLPERRSVDFTPRRARGAQVLGLTDTVTNVSIATPNRRGGGTMMAVGPLSPLSQADDTEPVSSWIPFGIPKDYYTYETEVRTYRRHTFRWMQVAAGVKTLPGLAKANVKHYMQVVDEYAGSGAGWSEPVSITVPYPTTDGGDS